MSTAEGKETARLLVQTVSRAFYEPRQSIVLDQLIRKEAMRDDELAGRVGMPAKDLAKIAQRLIEDQIVAVHRRQELKDGAPKAQQRTYYFMDYSHATDVIKWRMYKIQHTIDDRLRNELESQGYVCPQCRKAFTTLDAGTLVDPYRGGFFCDVCDHELQDNENEEEVRGSKDRTKRLMEQTTTIRDLLKRMDDVILPRFDVIKWLALNGPEGATATDEAPVAGTSVRIELAGDDDEALMKAKREADAAEKRSQNQLPSWIAQSTITDEKTGVQLEHEASASAASLAAHESKPDLKPDPALLADVDVSASLDDYYANLAEEAAPPPSVEGTPKLEALSDEEDFLSAAVQAGFDKAANGANSGGGGGSGKRSRDEVDSGWGEEEPEGDFFKKARRGESAGEAPEEEEQGAVDYSAGGGGVDYGGLALDGDEGDGDEFDDGEDDDADPNPPIVIGDKTVPFLEVDEALQAEMTPDEYTAYWNVFARLG